MLNKIIGDDLTVAEKDFNKGDMIGRSLVTGGAEKRILNEGMTLIMGSEGGCFQIVPLNLNLRLCCVSDIHKEGMAEFQATVVRSFEELKATLSIQEETIRKIWNLLALRNMNPSGRQFQKLISEDDVDTLETELISERIFNELVRQ